MLTARRKLKQLTGFEDSFLGHRFRKNPDYKFLPHYWYFLNNYRRWKNADQLQVRILATIPSEFDQAWEVWRQFRSAQSEITSIFLIENYLRGKVAGLEISPPEKTKSCDIAARFASGALCFLEVKSQSGQQHGDKHPLSSGGIGFTPQGEDDLRSWLFEERSSSITGEPMVPYCMQASDKGADVLIAFMDIFRWETHDAGSLGKVLVPDIQGASNVVYRRDFWKQLSCQNVSKGFLQWIGLNRDSLCVHAFEAGTKTSQQMGRLRELWLLKSSALAEMIVIRSCSAERVLDDADA